MAAAEQRLHNQPLTHFAFPAADSAAQLLRIEMARYALQKLRERE
jgi:hypothetical protein